jgi:rhamnulokinase
VAHPAGAQRAQGDLSYSELTELAAAAPPGTALLSTLTTSACCGQATFAPPSPRCAAKPINPRPRDAGTLVRVLLESLAHKYTSVLTELEAVTGQAVSAIHVVGGGSNNELLNELTARATGKLVRAGPFEATAIGNLLVQAIALGELRDLTEARALVARSFPARAYS